LLVCDVTYSRWLHKLATASQNRTPSEEGPHV
jgi:hypothetical protein